MKKSELIDAIAVTGGMSKKAVEAFLRDFCTVVRREVREGNEIRLQDVGTFKRVTRAARKGRNPITGEKIDVQEKNVVKFVPVKGFMD